MNESTLEPTQPEPDAPAAPPEDLEALWQTAEPIPLEPSDPAAPEDLDVLWQSATPIPLEAESPASRRQRIDVEERAPLAELPGAGVDSEDDAALRALVRSLPPDREDRGAALAQIIEQTGIAPDIAERNLDQLLALKAAQDFSPKKWRLDHPDEARALKNRVRSGLDKIILKDENATDLTRRLRGVGAVLKGGFTNDEIPWYVPAGPFRFPAQIGGALEAVTSGAAEEAMAPRLVPVMEDDRSREIAGKGLFGRLYATYEESRKGARLNSLYSESALARAKRRDPTAIEAEIADLKAELAPRVNAQGDVEQYLHDMVETGASQVDQMKGSVAAGAAGFIAGAVATRTLPGAAGGAVTGAKIGSTFETFDQEFGSTYGAIRDVTTEAGERPPEELSIGISLLAAGGKSAIEGLSFGAAEKAAGPVLAALKTGGVKAAAKAMLADGAWRGVAAKIGKGWLAHGGTESGEEFLQNYVDEIAPAAQLSIQTGSLQELPEGAWERSVDVVGKTLVGVGPTAAAGTIASTAGNYGVSRIVNSAAGLAVEREIAKRIRERNGSARSAEAVGVLHEYAGTDVAKASPAAAAEIIASASEAAGEEITGLHVDPKAVQKWFQDNPESDPAELLGPDHATLLQDALRTGGKLEVPVAEYFAKWIAHPSSEVLAEHVATRPQHETVAEMKAAADAKDAAPASEPETRLIAALKDQLEATGVHNAGQARYLTNLWRSVLRNQAERFGVAPDVLFEGYAVHVEGRLDAARPPEKRKKRKPPVPPAAAVAEGVQTPQTGETRVITPQRPQGERARYKVIEAADLIPSHDPNTFQPNPAYPGGVQEREYHRQAEEQTKVALGGQHLNPALLLADSPTAVDGPPLVTSGARALVMGGNGRSMMLLRGLANPTTAAAYRAALAGKAAAFGVDPKSLEGMKNPVLVRELSDVAENADPAELVAAVRRTNEGLTQALSPRARAVAEARSMSAETLQGLAELLAAEPDSSLRDVMRDRPAAIIDILRRDGVITAQNASQWTAAGNLTDEAKDRLEGMFLGRVVGSGDRFAQTAPGILAKLERLTPHLLRVAGTNPEMDEIPAVQAALDLLNDARRRGLSLRDLVGQVGLFDQGKQDPAVVRVAQLLDEGKPRDLTTRFKEWADLAAFDPRQMTMFKPNPTREQVRQQLLDPVVVAKHEQGGAVILYQPAFHGSPHQFERFSVQHIGTGEGAQVYGHGLYFAEEREVAEQYRQRLGGDVEIDGRQPQGFSEQVVVGMLGELMRLGWDPAFARKSVRKDLAERLERARAMVAEGREGGQQSVQNYEAALDLVKTLDLARVSLSKGQLYQVEVPDSDVLLDWDKKLTEQPPKVAEALRALGWGERWDVRAAGTGSDGTTLNDVFLFDSAAAAETEAARLREAGYQVELQERRDITETFTGESLYRGLSDQLGGPEAASEALRKEGIPGLRYLDQLSRDAGEGTRNFVIWDDSRIETKRTFYQDEAPGAAGEAALARVFAERTAKGLEQRDYWTDYNTGAYNERAVEAMPHDPARPFLASVDLEGAKAVNDNVSHAAQDLLLRAQVRAFHGLVPWVGKVGGGIQFSAVDAEDARRITELAQARLPNQRFRLLVAAAPRAEGAAFRDVMDAVSVEGKRAKDEARALGTFTARGDAPVHFLPKDQAGMPIPSEVTAEEKVVLTAEVKAALQAELERFPAQEPLGAADFDVDPKLLERSKALGPVGVALGTYIDPKTGLYTLDGWERLEAALPLASAASIDLAYLRDLDKVFGRDPTDKLITWFGRLLGRGLDFDFARLHGDEYAARHNNPEALADAIGLAREIGEGQTFFLKLPDGRLAVQQGLYFGQAVAETYLKADTLVEADKRETKDRAGQKGKPHVYEAGPDADALHAQLVAGGVALDLAAPLREVPLGLRGRVLAEDVGRHDRKGLGQGSDGLGAQPGLEGPGEVAPAAPPKKLFAGGPAKPRGSMERAGKQFRVVLEKSADLSTFLHESGHVFFELMGDLAGRPDAPQALRDDYAAARKWLGAKEGEPITREQHEQWARGFEAYLFEGKAPSDQLVSAFDRFKTWMVGVYRSIKNLRVQLTPEIRGVFDRLLASDAEIARARENLGRHPLFRSAEEMGTTPEGFADYLEAEAKATSRAARRAELRMMKDAQRAQEAWYREELAKFRAEAERAYEELPARRASLAMTGKVVELDGSLVDGGAKIPPDLAAEMFGFPTTEALLEAATKLAPKEVWAAAKADELMEIAHPSLLGDRARLKELIAQELHADEDLAWLIREWDALRARSGQGKEAVDGLKKAAAETAGRQVIGRINAGLALRRERSFADKAARAAAEGSYRQAAVYKLQQLINAFLWRELTGAVKERDHFLDLAIDLKAQKARERLGLAHPALLDGADRLLAALGLADAEERDTDPASLGETVKAIESFGTAITFDEEVIGKILAKAAGARPDAGPAWKRLTVDEMRQVVGILTSIQETALRATTAVRNGKRIDKETAIWILGVEAAENLKNRGEVASSESARTLKQVVDDALNLADGMLRKPGEMILKLGGKDLHSAWYEFIVKPLQEAKYRAHDLLTKTAQPIIDTFNAMPKEVRNGFMTRIDGKALFPTHAINSEQKLQAPQYLFELLMMALNAGNESNLERLLEGRNITMEQLQAAFDKHLTKEMLEWVQSVWDASESLWPLVEDLQRRTTGLAPPKLELRPLVTAHGTFRGGYFPAIYDRRVELAGEKQEATTIAELLDPGFTLPGTSKSHTKNRVEGFTGVISLEPSNVPVALSKVIHDLAYREALQSVGGLILNKKVQAILKTYLGDGRARQLLPWLKDVGQMRSMDGAVHAAFGMKAIRFLKANMVRGILGYSLPTMIADYSQYLAAVPGSKIKTQYHAAAVSEYSRNPRAADKWAHEKSGELRSRRDQIARELAREVKQIIARRLFNLPGAGFAQDALRFYAENAFVLLEVSDRTTSTPIWIGAYRQALAEGESEEGAVTFANAQIQHLFPGHSAVDRAGILRDKGFFGTVLLFYGFWNVGYNVMADHVETILGHDQVQPAPGKARAKRAGELLGYLLAIGAAAEYLASRGAEPPPDDETAEQKAERLARWALRKTAMTVISAAGLGDLASGIEQKMLGRQSNPRNIGIATAVLDLGTAVLNLPDEDKELDKRVTALLRGVMPWVGGPPLQSLRMGQYAADVVTEESTPRNPLDVASGGVYGEREGQGANPLSDLADAVGEL